MKNYYSDEMPSDLLDMISGDFTFRMTSLFKDSPGYLSNLVLDLDRLIDQPEDERQALFKNMMESIKEHIPADESKTIII
ncbi:hypothetical protein RYA05_04890 [Pseudomonas syringae pv. actinidiae]|nr:hypothetical protein [Pseudomonas syringae pv. actinidiae]